MTFNKIIVEPIVSTTLGVLKQEMTRLSNKYNCEVITKFNGQDISVKKFDYPLL